MILLYSLENCPYSINAEKILDEKNMKHKIISVNPTNKYMYKRKNQMLTFPQVYYLQGKKTYKIGGFNELNKIANLHDKLILYDGIHDTEKYKNMIDNTKRELGISKHLLKKIIKLMS